MMQKAKFKSACLRAAAHATTLNTTGALPDESGQGSMESSVLIVVFVLAAVAVGAAVTAGATNGAETLTATLNDVFNHG